MKSALKTMLLMMVTMLLATFHGKEHYKSNNDFVLAKEGKCFATIILSNEATPKTIEATKELIQYIEKISGVRPQLLFGRPKIMPKKVVWIGYQDTLKSIFPNINFKLKQEEILIAANQNNLLILGRDRFIKGYPKVIANNDVFENFQKEYGTINAIYTFIQDYLDVRWFFPTEFGEDIIKKDKIVFSPFVYRYEPQIKARSGLFIKSRLAKNKKPTSIDIWAQRNRIQFSSEFFNAGHPFVNWWEKYKDSHPKIFALTSNLSRTPLRDPKYVKLCISNEEIDALWLKEIETEMANNPYQRIFSVNENDGYGSGFCVCENCKKLDHNTSFSKQLRLADRHLHFANRLGTALNKKYPDRNYKVLFQAYGADRPLPLKEKPNKHVIVSSVANFHLRRYNNNMMQDKNVLEYYNWSQIAHEQFWRPNLGSPVGKEWGLPDIALNQAFEDFKFVGETGCSGIFFDSFLDHWSTQGPHYYVVAQLAWNPFLKKEQVFNDFYKRAYGLAEAEMRSYWDLLEKTRQKHFESFHNVNSRFLVHKSYNEPWFSLAFSYLEKAANKLNTIHSKKHLERVKFAKQGLIFAQKIVKIRALMSDYEQSNNQKIRNEIEIEWRKVDELKTKMNPLAINFGYVKYLKNGKDSGSYTRRMTGLLPDKPITTKILKQMTEDKEGLE